MKSKGNFFSGFVVGVLTTLATLFILPAFWGVSGNDEQKILIAEAMVAISRNKPQEIGFIPVDDYQNVTMLYRYANGDILFRTKNGALIWQHMDPDNRKCYGAPLQIMPAECR